MAAVAILDLLGAYLDLSGLCRCAKYGWNRCSSFDNMRVSLFCALGLKTPIHAPKNRELGDKSGGTETFSSFIPLGIQYPSTHALQIKRRKNPLCRFGSRREQNFESQKRKTKNHATVICSMFPDSCDHFELWRVGYIADVITRAKCYIDRFRGFGVLHPNFPVLQRLSWLPLQQCQEETLLSQTRTNSWQLLHNSVETTCTTGPAETNLCIQPRRVRPS